MKVQFFHIWHAYPVLNKIYSESVSGKLRQAAKRNARRMKDAYDEIIEWVRADKEDHGWEGDAIPLEDPEFVERFAEELTGRHIEFQPYLFSEELMMYADGITGRDENKIAWLFIENEAEDRQGDNE